MLSPIPLNDRKFFHGVKSVIFLLGVKFQIHNSNQYNTIFQPDIDIFMGPAYRILFLTFIPR